MLKFIEIREEPTCYVPETRSCKTSFCLREVYVNPDYIVLARENTSLRRKSSKGPLVEGLHSDVFFTEMIISTPGHMSKTINVIGATEDIIKNCKKAQS